MLVKGTYFQNDKDRPLVYGDVEINNVKRQRLRGEELKDGVLCEPVMIGFCGTDNELMHMGSEGRLSAKFPEGTNRLSSVSSMELQFSNPISLISKKRKSSIP